MEEVEELQPCLSLSTVLGEQSDALGDEEEESWFSLTDAKRPMNKPVDVEEVACQDVVFRYGGDRSRPSGEVVLPCIMEKTTFVIIACGAYVL